MVLVSKNVGEFICIGNSHLIPLHNTFVDGFIYNMAIATQIYAFDWHK